MQAASHGFERNLRTALGVALSRDVLLPLVFLALLRAATYLMQGLVSVSLLPDFSLEGSTGGMGLAVMGTALDLVLWIAALKVALEAMTDARGFQGSDRGKADVVTDRRAVVLGMLLLACAFPIYLALLSGHAALAVVLGVAAIAWLPVAAHAAVFGSLLDALNPRSWIARAQAHGALAWQAPVVVAIAVLVGATAWLLLEPRVPAFALAIAARFCVFAGIAACCAFIGAATAGAAPDESADVAVADGLSPEEVDALEASQNVSSDDGRRASIDALAYLVRRGTHEKIHDRYRRLLLQAGDRDAASSHAAHYVGVLLQSGRHGKAISLYEEALSSNEPVRFQDPADCILLATKAIESNRRAAAHAVAAQFESLFPKHSWAIEAKLLRARLDVDQFGRIDQGILALSQVIAAHPERDADGSISALLRQWQAVGAKQ